MASDNENMDEKQEVGKEEVEQKMKKDDQEEEIDDDEDSGSSSEEEPVIELMVNQRARRANAGNKMSALIQSTSQEDDFYKSAYGGFNEDDADDVYASPAHSDVDEVDSDFDRPEEEDEPISDKEGEDSTRPRKKKLTKGYKEPKREVVEGARADLLAKNKKWAVARMGGPTVAANTVDAKTQAERLKEAEQTEIVNVESLRKYEQFELERKKKREKAGPSRRVPPPYVSVKHTPEGSCVVIPDIKVFNKPSVKISLLCPVTGRPAKYKDSLTGVPYSTPFAYKVIRDQYHKYMKQKQFDNNPRVAKFMEQFISS